MKKVSLLHTGFNIFKVFIFLTYVNTCLALPVRCIKAHIGLPNTATLNGWYQPPTTEQKLEVFRTDSLNPPDSPQYLGSSITPQRGWFRIGNLLLPNQFFMVGLHKLNLNEDILNRDLQPYFEIDSKNKSLNQHESGGSAALRNELTKYHESRAEKLELVRIMGSWEKNIWLQCKNFRSNPTHEQLLKLLEVDLKEARPFVESFLDKNLSKQNVTEILVATLSILGRDKNFGRIFLAPKSSLLKQFPNSNWMEFHLNPKSDMSNWFFGIEPGYIEILAPKDHSRLLLLDALVL